MRAACRSQRRQSPLPLPAYAGNPSQRAFAKYLKRRPFYDGVLLMPNIFVCRIDFCQVRGQEGDTHHGGMQRRAAQRRLRPGPGRRRAAGCSTQPSGSLPPRSRRSRHANAAREAPHQGDHPGGATECAPPSLYPEKPPGSPPCRPNHRWLQPPTAQDPDAGKKYRNLFPGFTPSGAGRPAERRIGELMAAQAKTIGKATPRGSNQHKQRGSRNADGPPSLAAGGF